MQDEYQNQVVQDALREFRKVQAKARVLLDRDKKLEPMPQVDTSALALPELCARAGASVR